MREVRQDGNEKQQGRRLAVAYCFAGAGAAARPTPTPLPAKPNKGTLDMEDSVLELPQTSYAMALSEMTLGRTSSGHPETVTSLEEKGSLWAPPTARQELGSKRMQCLVGTSIMTEAHTGGEEGEAAAGAAGGWGATTAEDGVVGSRAAAAASGAMASGDADVLVSRGRRRAPRGRQRGKIRLGSGGGAVGVARDKGLGLTKRGGKSSQQGILK